MRFRLRKANGKTYRKHLCTKCDDEYQKKYTKPQGVKDRNRKSYLKRKERRARGEIVEIFLLEDCRRIDRKKGIKSDLDSEYIAEIIKDGCAYCGDIESRIGLDRIDNSLGHMKGNVNACCMRCNLIRRDMPYEAWLIVAPTMKIARESKAFGNWNVLFGNKKKTERGPDDKATGCYPAQPQG